MIQNFRPALVMLLLMTILTGALYPLATTGLGQLLFPRQAQGSLIERDGKVIGSTLIGQNFTGQRYFNPRPSGAGANGYDASASSGTNLGPTSKTLVEAVSGRVTGVQAQNPQVKVPLEWITASGSGLDPDISPASARFQVPSIAKVRGLSEAEVQKLVDENTEGRTFGLLGEPRINVLQLNLALDVLSPFATPQTSPAP